MCRICVDVTSIYYRRYRTGKPYFAYMRCEVPDVKYSVRGASKISWRRVDWRVVVSRGWAGAGGAARPAQPPRPPRREETGAAAWSTRPQGRQGRLSQRKGVGMPSPSRHPGTVPLACAMSTPGLAHGGTTARPLRARAAAVLARGWMVAAAAAAGAAGRRPRPEGCCEVSALPDNPMEAVTSSAPEQESNPPSNDTGSPDRCPSRPLAGSARPRPSP